jgi:trk system potassium uptake protein TrkA
MNVLEIPVATDVIDFAEGRVKLVGIQLRLDSPLVGKPLAKLREEYPDRKLFIPAILRESEVLIPKGNDVLQANDAIYLMAPIESLQSAMEIAGGAAKGPKKFFMVGGSTVGLKIAQELEGRGFSQLTLIEADPVRCEEIAAMLDHTLVLNSDTVDEPFLRGEGVAESDVFMAVTDDDEHNALVALLAKRVGASRVAALTNKVDYHRLLSAVGIDIVVNPRLTAASRILQYIRKGKVISVSMLPGEEVEALEFEAMETSRLVGKPLRKLKFPKGAILGGVERAGVFFIPDGDTRIEPGDRTVFFAKKDAVSNIEKLVTVGLSYF